MRSQWSPLCTNPLSLSDAKFQIRNRDKRLCLEAGQEEGYPLKSNQPCDAFNRLQSFSFVWSDISKIRGRLALFGTNICVDSGVMSYTLIGDNFMVPLGMGFCSQYREGQIWTYEEATGQMQSSAYRSSPGSGLGLGCVDDNTDYAWKPFLTPFLWPCLGSRNQVYDIIPIGGMLSTLDSLVLAPRLPSAFTC